MKIGLCGNIKFDLIAFHLDKNLPGNDIVLGYSEAFESELQNPPQEFTKLDFCILALDWKRIVPEVYAYNYGGDFENACISFVKSIKRIEQLLTAFRSVSNTTVLIFSPVTDPRSPTGFIERLIPFSHSLMFSNFHAAFNEFCRSLSAVYPVDLNAICNRIGWNNAFDRQADYNENQPFSALMIDVICSQIVAICTQLIKYPLKCLILDLDNTLWGGVVGEAGASGVILCNSGPGKAFRDFQVEVVKLYNQGVLIAICSKNNTCDALEVLERHEGMLVRVEMVSCFRINWDEKPRNIIEISEELNIGLNSLMFIDDDPAERALVRSALPEVEVLNLPLDPAQFADCLAQCTRFWPVELTREDAKKGDFVQREKIRKRLATLAKTKEEFLYNSKINARIGIATKETLPRIAQLFNKTNQFNLTSKRYSPLDLEEFLQEESNRLYFIELNDKFGEYGIVGSALIIGNTIDSFLLSCRVFGKQAEKAFLAWILSDLKGLGATIIEGVYAPSQRNNLVKDFYRDSGFVCKSYELKKTLWEIDLRTNVLSVPPWIKV